MKNDYLKQTNNLIKVFVFNEIINTLKEKANYYIEDGDHIEHHNAKLEIKLLKSFDKEKLVDNNIFRENVINKFYNTYNEYITADYLKDKDLLEKDKIIINKDYNPELNTFNSELDLHYTNPKNEVIDKAIFKTIIHLAKEHNKYTLEENDIETYPKAKEVKLLLNKIENENLINNSTFRQNIIIKFKTETAQDIVLNYVYNKDSFLKEKNEIIISNNLIAKDQALKESVFKNHNKMSTENQNQEKPKSDKQYHTFTGTLGADADVKEVKGEKLVAAISVYVKEEGGNSKRHDATLWDETIEKHFTAKKMENFDKNTIKEFADNLKKGDQVKINGYFKDVDYKDKEGNPKTKQEFVITNFNNHTPKADIKHDQSENVKITGKINNDPIITDEDGKKKAVFYINYKPTENSDWVSKKCQVIGEYVDKCKIGELKKGDIATIEGFEGSKYERTIKGTENKETVSDIFVGETKVVKQSQEKSQEQSQSSGIGM